MPDGFGLDPFGLTPFGGAGVAGVARATYNLQVAWSAYNLGICTFDFSTFDGPDTLGVSPLDASFGGPYDDISDLLRSGSWTRGAADNLTKSFAGTGTFLIRDPDNRFNPNNPLSPLYGQIEARLHPCKLTAIYDDVVYPLFYGWVKADLAQPGIRRSFATLNCVDLLYWLGRAYPVIASTGTTTTGAAIGLVLDAVGWTGGALRDLDVGDTIPDFSADGSKSGSQIIEELLQAERGFFFHAGTGKATYRSRLRQFQGPIGGFGDGGFGDGGFGVGFILPSDLGAIFTDDISNVTPTVDFDLVQNRVTVKRTQTAYSAVKVDQPSANRIGYADLPTIETPYLLDDAQADDLASWILSQVSSPKPPLHDLTVDNREAALLTQILLREITDRVTVHESSGDTSGDFILQRLQHTLDEHGNHTAVYATTRAPTTVPILFDSAVFDSDAVFVY